MPSESAVRHFPVSALHKVLCYVIFTEWACESIGRCNVKRENIAQFCRSVTAGGTSTSLSTLLQQPSERLRAPERYQRFSSVSRKKIYISHIAGGNGEVGEKLDERRGEKKEREEKK